MTDETLKILKAHQAVFLQVLNTRGFGDNQDKTMAGNAVVLCLTWWSGTMILIMCDKQVCAFFHYQCHSSVQEWEKVQMHLYIS